MNRNIEDHLKSYKTVKCETCGNTAYNHINMLHPFMHPKLPDYIFNNPNVCNQQMCFNYGMSPPYHLRSCTFGKIYCDNCRGYQKI